MCRPARLRPRASARHAFLLVVLAGTGCASPIALRGGVYHHADREYAIRAPGGAWSRIAHERADLAFRGPGGAVMAMMSRCRSGTQASSAALARQLLFGLGDYTVRNGGPVSVAGRDGWRQTLEMVQDGRPLHLKTVTTKTGRCVYDLLLTARDSFEQVEPDFDAWWSSIRIAPDAGPRAEGEP